MLNKTKNNEILKAKELLRVDTVFQKMPNSRKKVAMFVISVIFVVSIIYFAWINKSSSMPKGFSIGIFLILALLYGLVLIVVSFLNKTRGNPLVFTTRGIVMYPLVSEYWEDIEDYQWEEFTGIKRLPGPTLFSTSTGTCLRLINKGFFQRNLENHTGHSIFATWGIFFSPDQIIIAEKIFQEHGIKKRTKN